MSPVRSAVPTLAAIVVLTAPGCHGQRATDHDCRAIFERIVDVELSEMGFRDPALAERKKAALVRQFESELEACVGRPLPAGALRCVEQADSTEAISHTCLR